MTAKTRTLFFFALLFAVLAFLVGFRAGRFVEHTDKTYVPTTPTPLPPTPIEPTDLPIKLETFYHDECKISFLYQNNFDIDTISSQEAKLSNGNEDILFSCDRQTVFAKKEALTELETVKTATISGQKIPLYQKNTDTTIFTINSPLLGRSIFFEVSDNLAELLLQTLKFVK